ncbi:MAG TPA: CrcB family protein, partial [Solirubrobacterales bacterium]|nr:CrcB family protein [Solirubrobacterales bacterium]
PAPRTRGTRARGGAMSAGAWVLLATLGGLGAVARLVVGSAVVAAARGAQLPLGTLFVNLTGSFALGLLVGASVSGTAIFVLGAGLLGSYSTFSSWMMEAALEIEWGRRRLALAYLVLSLAGGLAAIFLGRALATALT